MGVRKFPQDFQVHPSPSLESYVFVDAKKISITALAALLGSSGTGLASTDAIALGQLTPPTDLSEHGAIPADSWCTIVRGAGIYAGLDEQSGPATTRLLYVTESCGLVPYGYPSSIQTINGGTPGEIYPLEQPGLYVLIGDGTNGWTVLHASPATTKDDLRGVSGIPDTGFNAAAGWSNGSRILTSGRDLYFCTDAGSGTWKQVAWV